MNHPSISTISIGMSAYNSALTIADAIESIRSQDFENWSLTIIDAKSTDDTARICKWFSFIDNRIRVISLESRANWYQNAKFHLDMASGPYFMWADPDDYWSSSWLSSNMRVLAKGRCSASFGRICVIDASSRIIDHPAGGRVFRGVSYRNAYARTLNFLLDPEPMGKANLIYSLWKLDVLKEFFPLNYDDFGNAKDLNFLANFIQFHRIGSAPNAIIYRRVTSGIPLARGLNRAVSKDLSVTRFSPFRSAVKVLQTPIPFATIRAETQPIKKLPLRILATLAIVFRITFTNTASAIVLSSRLVWRRASLLVRHA